MSEFKIKAWDKTNKRMLPAISPWEFGEDNEFGLYWNIDINNEESINIIKGMESKDELILLMCSNETDRRGVTIDEGDIIRVSYEEDDEDYIEELHGSDSRYYLVEFKNGMLRSAYDNDYGNFEISSDNVYQSKVGNIYENPELLKNPCNQK